MTVNEDEEHQAFALVIEDPGKPDLNLLHEIGYHASQALQNLVLYAAGSGMISLTAGR